MASHKRISRWPSANGKLAVFQLQWSYNDPLNIYAGLLGGMVLTLGTHGTDQMMVQRYLCAPSVRDAGRALIVSGVVVLMQFTLFLLVGVGLFCFYQQFPPETPFASNDEVFAAFIVNHLPVGVVGVTLAAVFAAAMSTLSSSLNSSASAALHHFGCVRRAASSQESTRQVTAGRALTMCFGILQITIAIVAQTVSKSVVQDALAIAGFSAGILLGVFLLGTYVPGNRNPGNDKPVRRLRNRYTL